MLKEAVLRQGRGEEAGARGGLLVVVWAAAEEGVTHPLRKRRIRDRGGEGRKRLDGIVVLNILECSLHLCVIKNGRSENGDLADEKRAGGRFRREAIPRVGKG